MEENETPQEIADLRKAINEFMNKKGTAIGFFASKEWEDQVCVAVNGKRERLVNMIVNSYFQNESVREILGDVMVMINDVIELQKKSMIQNTFQIPVNIDKSKMS